jgi:hypothetical protein
LKNEKPGTALTLRSKLRNDSRFRRCFLETVDVGEILRSAYGFLIGDQMCPRDDENQNILNVNVDTLSPGFIKQHTIDRGQNIYSAQRQSINHSETPKIALLKL